MADDELADEVKADVEEAPGELNAIWGHIKYRTSTLNTGHGTDPQQTSAQKVDTADQGEMMPDMSSSVKHG